jgi:hypothetical protein
MGARDRPNARSEHRRAGRFAGGPGKGNQTNARGGGSSIWLRSQDETGDDRSGRIGRRPSKLGPEGAGRSRHGPRRRRAVIGEATSRAAKCSGSTAVGRNQNHRSQSSAPRRLSVKYFPKRLGCHLCHGHVKATSGSTCLSGIRRRAREAVSMNPDSRASCGGAGAASVRRVARQAGRREQGIIESC